MSDKPSLPVISNAFPLSSYKVGYARVSTWDQDPQLQIDALLRDGVKPPDIWEDRISGAAAKRPVLEAMLKDLRPGDTVVVWKLDRLGRNAEYILQVARKIQEKGAYLRILDFGMDTSTAGGTMMFQVLAAFAEFERNLIRERTMAGLAAARERGKRGGREARFTHEQVLAAFEQYGLLGGARSLTYKDKGRDRHMTKAGFQRALERARKAQKAGELNNG